jgi:hypothetical protein
MLIYYGTRLPRCVEHAIVQLTIATVPATVIRIDLVDAIYGTGCDPSMDMDARSIGLDWCRRHDSRWDLSDPRCDKAL